MVTRSMLLRVNEQQPHQFYETLFEKLYAQCVTMVPRHPFRFRNKLYSLDASTIDLSLSIFPWAKFRKKDGAVKLHVGLDHEGGIPAFVSLTEGRVHEVNEARKLDLPAQSSVVMDRGYLDYSWYKQLTEKGIYFVTRARRNMWYQVTERRSVDKSRGLRADQSIRLIGLKSLTEALPVLRRVTYVDPDTGQRHEFLTNQFALADRADFRWIKQNLKIRCFLGTSKNAVLTQIWVSICILLLLAYLKYLSRVGASMQHILRRLQINLFMRRDLFALLRGDSPDQRPPDTPQLCLV